MAISLLQEIVVTNMIGSALRLYPAFGQCGSGMITKCLSGFAYWQTTKISVSIWKHGLR
nr:MAG TPA: hypothetical protein [Caudoviricetes sp.]DAT01193.1 MAG TPA: hypothetical protein [Caudoviricetes sp.]DAW71508.1 MAG TPA: hypothetical protein [Caudoviricetes sp.]